MKVLYLILSTLLLISCGPAPVQLTSTAVRAQAQTQTAAPTLTPTLPPTPTLTPTATPVISAGLIAFEANRNDNYDIYLMNADGSGVIQLTSDLADDDFPAWSPNGEKIAFTSFRDGNAEIYVMDSNGNNVTRLTNNEATDSMPAFSPDGTQLAFVSTLGGDSEDIYIMNLDGSSSQRLTNIPSNYELTASGWAPNGLQITYSRKVGDDFEVFIQNLDGTELVQLTDNSENDGGPAWSPDGKQIAFHSNRDGNFEIYMMNLDGSNVARLTNNDRIDGYPVWSPDGTRLVYFSDFDNNRDIFVIDVSSKESFQITDSLATDDFPSWSTRFIAALPTPNVNSMTSPTEQIPCRFIEVVPVKDVPIPTFSIKAEGFRPFSQVFVKLIAGNFEFSQDMLVNSKGIVEGELMYSMIFPSTSFPKNYKVAIDVNESCSIQQDVAWP